MALTELARRELFTAADTIRMLSRNLSPGTASQVDPQQAGVLSRMHAILASMIQSEGYHEVVNMLQEIRIQCSRNDALLSMRTDDERGQ